LKFYVVKQNHLLPNSWHIDWNFAPRAFLLRIKSGIAELFRHLSKFQQKLSEYGWEISVRQLLLVFMTIWLSTGKWVENLGPFFECLKAISGMVIWKITVRLMMTIRKKSRWCEMFGRIWMDQRPGLEKFGRITDFLEEFESVE